LSDRRKGLAQGMAIRRDSSTLAEMPKNPAPAVADPAPPDDLALAAQTYAIGQPARRLEDARLVRGQGRFTDDVNRPDQAYLVMVRSNHAHGTIRAIDVAAAQSRPGVLGVFTQKDLSETLYGRIECRLPFKNADGSPLRTTHRTVLADQKVRFVGDPLAFVVATSLADARAAAEDVVVDIEPLPALAEPRAALQPGAPLIYDDIPGNLALDYHLGETDKVAAAFAGAAHITTLDIAIPRLVVGAIEPRAALGEYDAAQDRYLLHIPTQGVVAARTLLTKDLLRVPPEQVRILSGDVGGSFGMKMGNYPEYACVLHAARTLRRPIKWTDTRSTSFLSDHHGRASHYRGELALDTRGRILALRITGTGDMGAYLAAFGPLPASSGTTRNLASVYATPLIESSVQCALTNTTIVSAYRGAGRPEGNFLIERLLDAAAFDLGISPVAIRRRNFIKPKQIPYRAASGMTYDSGNFPALFERALEMADYKNFAARRRAARSRGFLRGIGVGAYLEITAGNIPELGKIVFNDDDTITFLTGSLDFGQGHRTAFLQVMSARLGVPIEKLRLDQNDSDALGRGGSSGGSRSLMVSGAAMIAAIDQVIDKGKSAAAHWLEAAVDDIAFADGRFAIAGTDRGIGLIELAKLLKNAGPMPDDVPPSLDVDQMHEGVPSTFPNGAQVAEVEIDIETGAVAVVSYFGVNDFGTIVNPMIVAGQVQGGVIQGLGEALMEQAVYDADGQLLTGSFLDYALPRAKDAPTMVLDSMPSPTASNPLGVKGAGEAGCAGGLPSVVNAVIHALSEYGIRHIDMPLNSEKIWRAMRDSARGVAAAAAKRG